MTRKELVDTICGVAGAIYEPREAKNIALMVSEHISGVGRSQLIADPQSRIIVDGKELLEACNRLSACEPVQYILGETEFFGLDFRVTPDVLIPRPETEELVGWIKDNYGGNADGLKILDIGTGSGAIAITLVYAVLGSEVMAVDISENALAVARENAGRHLLSRGIEFACVDILKPLHGTALYGRWFDVIVSNPPYIPESERKAMHDNVLRYEPDGALFVDDGDPLMFYREIGLKGQQLLVPGGELYFEIHENFSGQVAALLDTLGYCDMYVKSDINGKPRMVRCRKK